MMMQLEQNLDGRWAVQLGFCKVLFAYRNDAENYLATLRSRVQAPHVLPELVTPMTKK